MNYWVIIDQQLSILVEDVKHVSVDKQGFVHFTDKYGDLCAAYKLETIVGFCKETKHVHQTKREYKWDFTEADKSRS